MRSSMNRLPALALLAGALACAGPRGLTVGDGEMQPRHDLITRDQLMSSAHNDAFEAIQRLRPYWIARGGNDTPQNPGKIQVYLDGTRLGELPALRHVPMAGITYIRFYDGLQAASRWGLDHERGVIYVSTLPPDRQ